MLLPGLGGGDRRIVVDASLAPWTGVAKLQVAGVSRCTAVLVAPQFMATAAHCLTKPSLGHFVQAGSIHLLFGYDGGSFARHVVPDAVILAPGADPATRTAHGADLALLHLAQPLPAPLPLATEPLPRGAALRLAGFNQDRAQRLEIDPACQGLGSVAAHGGRLLAHDCEGTRGSSGGPLLTAGGAVAGIQVAGRAGAGGYAVPAAAVAALLPD